MLRFQSIKIGYGSESELRSAQTVKDDTKLHNWRNITIKTSMQITSELI